jgi:pyruvate dehydrogenase E1 component alpha subunit
MTGERVDGDDLEAVIEVSSGLLEKARAERKPAVLEAVTYRYRGHSVADAGLAYRTREEIAERRERDPLERARALLRSHGTGEEQIEAAGAEAQAEVARATEFAAASPAPEVERLAAGMYAPGSEGQFERMIPGSPLHERELVYGGGLGR